MNKTREWGWLTAMLIGSTMAILYIALFARVSVHRPCSARIEWEAVSDNSAIGYRLYYWYNGGSTNTVTVLGKTTTNCEIQNLKPRVTYHVHITSFAVAPWRESEISEGISFKGD